MIKIKHSLRSVWVVLAFLIALEVSAAPTNQENVDQHNQQVILSDINHYRTEHGLGSLKMDPLICEEAIKHSREMADNSVSFGHDGFNSRMKNLYQQIRSVHGIAENVAFTQVDARSVVQLWLASPGHRKNIEGNFNLSGIGIARDKNGAVYVTQIFLLVDE